MSHFFIITGTNGVGKSSFGEYLSKNTNIAFINVDLYYKFKFGEYREFNQNEILETSKELSDLRKQYFMNHQSFALEKILTDKDSIINLLKTAKSYDFKTTLIYIGTDDTFQTSKKRIDNRVKKGLHYVEPNIIEKNLQDVIKHFKILASEFDNIIIYDNSKDYSQPKRILDIRNKEIYITNSLPEFAKDLIQNTFIERKLKDYD